MQCPRNDCLIVVLRRLPTRNGASKIEHLERSVIKTTRTPLSLVHDCCYFPQVTARRLYTLPCPSHEFVLPPKNHFLQYVARLNFVPQTDVHTSLWRSSPMPVATAPPPAVHLPRRSRMAKTTLTCGCFSRRWRYVAVTIPLHGRPLLQHSALLPTTPVCCTTVGWLPNTRVTTMKRANRICTPCNKTHTHTRRDTILSRLRVMRVFWKKQDTTRNFFSKNILTMQLHVRWLQHSLHQTDRYRALLSNQS
jgi:hypothetical protein